LPTRPVDRQALIVAGAVVTLALCACTGTRVEADRERLSSSAATASQWAFESAAEDAVAAGRLGDARRLLLDRLTTEPSDGDALGLLAVVEFRLGRGEEALARAEAAHALAPLETLHATNLVLIAAAGGRLQRAVEVFERGRANDTFPPDLLIALQEHLQALSASGGDQVAP